MRKLIIILGIFLLTGAGIYWYYSAKIAGMNREAEEGTAITARLPERIRHFLRKSEFDDDNLTWSDFMEKEVSPSTGGVQATRFQRPLVFTDFITANIQLPTDGIYQVSLNKALGFDAWQDGSGVDGLILEHYNGKTDGYYVNTITDRKTGDAYRMYCSYTYLRLADTTVVYRDTVWGPKAPERTDNSNGATGGLVKEIDKVAAIRRMTGR